MFGPTTSEVPIAYAILHMGQSNGDGNSQGERLANTLWNYRGLLQNWPATRTTEDQYVLDPEGVHIYKKQNVSAGEWMADDGVWENYEVGVNSRNRIASGQGMYFGHENILAQDIYNATGKEVFIMKPSFPSTGLISNPAAPGPWNNVTRTIAAQAYIEKAVRDFKTYRPGVRLVLINCSWWQGEGDIGETSAAYQAAFASFYDMITKVIASYFVQPFLPVWNVVKLDYARSAGEIIINDALEAVCTTYGLNFVTDHTGKSLQKQEITSAQASPVTKGSPNALGGIDDLHTSYIGHQLVGQRCFANIQAAGPI